MGAPQHHAAAGDAHEPGVSLGDEATVAQQAHLDVA
jgi:hypothetical protein